MSQHASGIPQRKRIKTYNKKRVIFSLLLIIVLLCVAIHFALKLRRAYLRSKEIRNKQELVLKELEGKSDELETQLDLYASPVGQERLLRERYSYAKEGEHEIIIEEDMVTKMPETHEKKNWWNIIKKLLGMYE